MTHNPLCLCADDDTRCTHCCADDCACGCFDIRRVRPIIINEALDAAREAVAALQIDYPSGVTAAIAAIDALRGEE